MFLGLGLASCACMSVEGGSAVAVVVAGEEVQSWALFSHPQTAELTRRIGKYTLYLCFRHHAVVVVSYSSLLVSFDTELDKCPVK